MIINHHRKYSDFKWFFRKYLLKIMHNSYEEINN